MVNFEPEAIKAIFFAFLVLPLMIIGAALWFHLIEICFMYCDYLKRKYYKKFKGD